MNIASSSHDSLDKIAMTVLKCVSSLELRKKDLGQPKVKINLRFLWKNLKIL